MFLYSIGRSASKNISREGPNKTNRQFYFDTLYVATLTFYYERTPRNKLSCRSTFFYLTRVNPIRISAEQSVLPSSAEGHSCLCYLHVTSTYFANLLCVLKNKEWCTMYFCMKYDIIFCQM